MFDRAMSRPCAACACTVWDCGDQIDLKSWILCGEYLYRLEYSMIDSRTQLQSHLIAQNHSNFSTYITLLFVSINSLTYLIPRFPFNFLNLPIYSTTIGSNTLLFTVLCCSNKLKLLIMKDALTCNCFLFTFCIEKQFFLSLFLFILHYIREKYYEIWNSHAVSVNGKLKRNLT